MENNALLEQTEKKQSLTAELTCSSGERRVKTYQSQGNALDSMARGVRSRLNLCDWLTSQMRNTLSGKMYPACLVPTRGEISLPFYPTLLDARLRPPRTVLETPDLFAMDGEIDTEWRGECWTLNMCEWTVTLAPYLKEDGVCSLSDVLEIGKVPQKYYLSRTACSGILRRAGSRGKDLPPVLKAALERQAQYACDQESWGGGKGALVSTEKSLTLTADSNDQAVVLSMDMGFPGSYEKETVNSLQAHDWKSGHAIYSIGNGQVDSATNMQQELSHTLHCMHDANAVLCYENHGQDSRITELKNGVAPQINAKAGTGGNNLPLVQTVANTSCIRRLMPIECERLMGFPDNWTRIVIKRYKHKPINKRFKRTPQYFAKLPNGEWVEYAADSSRYKACGNSMCVNVMRWIGMSIENVIKGN